MDVQLDEPLPTVGAVAEQRTLHHPERLIGLYWLISVGLGLVVLWDWLRSWHVPATFGRPWLVLYLVCSLALSQIFYVLVAHHGGRPIHLGALAIFALGNGIAETLAFAVVYRLGETIGTSITQFFIPALAAPAGFLLGVIFFALYGGLIHGLFWLRVLPPHLNDGPRARAIRKVRPIGEVALVLGWSLCLWLTQDIWTVIFFHTLVDIGLMVLVRPAIFGAQQASV